MVKEERYIEVMEVFDENGNKIYPKNYNKIYAIKADGLDYNKKERNTNFTKIKQAFSVAACKIIDAATDYIIKEGIRYLDNKLLEGVTKRKNNI